ncbi:hypothetical protein [Phaeocystidibacter luteus]|uniref:Uncharacterized protein n=1 Tax=Phaeocystidibacter luteus TaxID=911197 RepID=A0A6N6RDG8_9FLAO|nr:hypothetical protein [Phaeocystidibacter luteus]KAB2807060.1 hypothetical protein F8C67_12765 [Phaeocystidibacter luteus]
MKHWVALLGLAIVGCQSSKKEESTSMAMTEPIDIQADELVVDPPHDTLDVSSLRLYQLQGVWFNYDPDSALGHVPLSDDFRFDWEDEHPIIAEAYLDSGYSETNYHEMTPENRAVFLDSVRIAEDDTLYIYASQNDDVIRLPVSELKLTAYVNVYDQGGSSYKSYDYIIGFELPELGMLKRGTGGYFGLGAIGKENPFVAGRMENLFWSESKEVQLTIEDAFKYPDLTIDSVDFTYYAEWENLRIYTADYYLAQEHSRGTRYWLFGRVLKVMDKSSGDEICNYWIQDGESTGLTPRTMAEHRDSLTSYQFIGQLFKDGPPALYGMAWESFGCESVFLIEPRKRQVYTRCENRH